MILVNLTKSILANYRARQSEYNYLQSKKRKKGLDKEQLRRMQALEEWLFCMNCLLMQLSEDERYVIQRHVIDGIDWSRISAEYASRWGEINKRSQRTLLRYQSDGLKKISKGLNHIDFPDID